MINFLTEKQGMTRGRPRNDVFGLIFCKIKFLLWFHRFSQGLKCKAENLALFNNLDAGLWGYIL